MAARRGENGEGLQCHLLKWVGEKPKSNNHPAIAKRNLELSKKLGTAKRIQRLKIRPGKGTISPKRGLVLFSSDIFMGLELVCGWRGGPGIIGKSSGRVRDCFGLVEAGRCVMGSVGDGFADSLETRFVFGSESSSGRLKGDEDRVA